MRDAQHIPPTEAVDPFALTGFEGHPACRMAALAGGRAGPTEAFTPAETARLARLKSPRRRAEMAASFELRRMLIGGVTGCRSEEVALEAGAEGAPVLLHPAGWSVSLSNKDAFTVVAVAPSPAEIGVDLEIVRAMNWRPALAMTSSDGEKAEIEAAAREIEADMRPFFRMWTLKEAALKATGLGFRAGPKAVQTPLAILRAPGAGALSAFGQVFDFWTADAGEAVVSLVRKQA